MLRKLLIAFLVLLVVAVVAADRITEHVAAHVLAGKLEHDEHLDSRPSVSIGGIPFLTQAFSGDYHDVTVTTHDFLTPDRVEIDTLTAQLHGVHIPLSKVVGGSVSTVPVDRVDGNVFVSFSEISSYLQGTGVTVTMTRATSNTADIAVRLSPRATLLRGVATVTANGSSVTLSVRVGGAQSAVHAPLSLHIPLQGLPFRFRVTSVQVGIDGISGTGTASHVVLGS
jgi:hypothetical protein